MVKIVILPLSHKIKKGRVELSPLFISICFVSFIGCFQHSPARVPSSQRPHQRPVYHPVPLPLHVSFPQIYPVVFLPREGLLNNFLSPFEGDVLQSSDYIPSLL